MSPRQDRPGKAAERRFFLEPSAAGAFGPGDRGRLADSDAEHARVVLRLAPGDRCIGLDGAGHAWPLVVTGVERKAVLVECSGAPTFEPAPGEPGAPLPWIEMAVALPRGSNADEMVDALAQLGAAALTPLLTERSSPAARAESDGRRARFERIAREAAKQSGRLWNLQIGSALDLEGLHARGDAVWVRCDTRATRANDLGALRDAPCTRARPLIVAIGPEGGFTQAEENWIDTRSPTTTLVLGPHVLRTETAAIAALAVIVNAVSRSSQTNSPAREPAPFD
jgi:16S rRNA (uracil1498-N3)-methyltransferase